LTEFLGNCYFASILPCTQNPEWTLKVQIQEGKPFAIEKNYIW